MYYELLDRVTPPATPYDVEINNNARKTFVKNNFLAHL